ncbi:AI-2E family transporter [Motilibacter aurantiacus]|uniref:AI-2E family transporter n=1 Tax=Motilibacter aurantiacus TaxID=2714955 RepID=UPI001408C65D|nr:AI-2E family transporter [Motilibacter aurantiacus]NHC44471.1 AI-2E family transporter [Motilibacter aurantiacus]
MSSSSRTRLQLDLATAVRVVAAGAGTLAVLLALDRARHVVAWALTAAAVAFLLDGPVRLLGRVMRRGLAVAVVTVTTLASIALVTYEVGNTVVLQYRRLQDAAPRAAADLLADWGVRDREQADELVDRVRLLIDEAPTRLLGAPREVAEGTLSRLAIFAVVATLAVFMLGSGRRALGRLAKAVAAATGDRLSTTQAGRGLVHGAATARRAVLHAAVAGLAVAGLGAAVDVPGAQPIGLWVAMWRLLPFLGLVVAYVPSLALLWLTVPREQALLVAASVLVVELAMAYLVHRRARRERPPVRLVSSLALLGGFEMYGVVGAVVSFVLAHVAAGVVRELLAEEAGDTGDGGEAEDPDGAGDPHDAGDPDDAAGSGPSTGGPGRDTPVASRGPAGNTAGAP